MRRRGAVIAMDSSMDIQWTVDTVSVRDDAVAVQPCVCTRITQLGAGLLSFVFQQAQQVAYIQSASKTSNTRKVWQRTSQMENDSVRSSQFNNMHVQEQSYYDTIQTSKPNT